MSGADQEDKKPEQSTHINLKVKGQDEKESELFFRIKRNTPLKKLMDVYCDLQSLDINRIAFHFDGLRIRGEQTPDELKLEDGDEIDAFFHQLGGNLMEYV